MFGNARGFQPGRRSAQGAPEVRRREALGADRKADAMAGIGTSPRCASAGKLRAAVHHVVFRMDFEPGNRAGRREDVFEMPGLVADAGSRRQTAALLGMPSIAIPPPAGKAGFPRPDGSGRGLHRPQPGRSRSSASGEPLRSPGISMATQVPRGTSDQALPVIDRGRAGAGGAGGQRRSGSGPRARRRSTSPFRRRRRASQRSWRVPPPRRLQPQGS